ncbi:unnamed protein product [Rhizoctonia solani]|uniref:DNA polymerase zeta catalytic subunit n=1 Tax=Rhizoctonia solani TaxID=456999 RepID=A0A8H3HLM2_9AGAM|nr:unnamed protein product [Rhizoctonia solani]
MADPGLVQRAATVLRSGAVMRQKIQTFETHISYIMQFMCDFGLYGCGWLEFSRYYLREGTMEAGTRGEHYISAFRQYRFDPSIDPLPGQFSKSPHPKVSRMSVEIDIISHQILNRNKLSQRHLHHKLNISTSAPPSEPLVQSVRELWDSERARRLANGLNPTPELPREGSASQRGAGGQWEQEPLFWEQLRARMSNPKAEVDTTPGWEKWVMTAFESVEALWEEGWKTWMPQLSGHTPGDGETAKPAIQAAQELNPFESTQVEQDGPQTTHASNPDDVDEDIAAGQALRNLVIAAEEGDDWHDTDEQWDDDLPIGDELEELSTQEGNPFLDADVTYPGPAKSTRVEDDTSPVTKRKKVTHEPGQEPTRKTTRWVDLEERLINITYRAPTPVAQASVYEYNRRPPSAKELVESLTDYGLPSKIYRVPYYSNEEDVPEQPMRYAGRVYHIKGGTGVGSLEHWESNEAPVQALQNVPEITGWEYAGVPPSSKVVKQWLDSAPSQDARRVPNIGRSQIEGPTQNTHGFKITQKKSASGARQKQTISAMSVEIFVCSREDLLPNPAEDGITCLFYSHSESGGDAEDRADYQSGCIVVCPDQPPLVDPRWIPGYKIEIVSTELDLLNALIDLVRDFDPDILAGWQVQTASWGYIDARCHSIGLVLSEEIARVSSNHGHKPGSEQWDERHGASFRVVGRHVLNVWRIMRSEQSLDQYTYENVVFHLIHKRVPKYSPKTLTQWFNSGVPSRVVRALRYWIDRTATILDLLDHTELILRTAESARIIGVDFMSVLTRGSQFKVESSCVVCSRGDLFPNPAEDGITCLFYSHSESGGDAEDRVDYQSGCIVVCPDQPHLVDPRWIPGYKIEIVSTELDLLNALIDLVREFDPDILAGWQVQTASWGYIDARCHSTGLVLSEEIARVASDHGHKLGSEQWDERHGASFHVVGRHVLNVWRVMRSEQSLDQYTYENVAFHLMHKRAPKYSPKTLTHWFNSGVPSRVVRVLKYWIDRTATILDLLDHTELILRTAESARIIGVDFMSVLTRGSQFKVESIMFKIAKQENYVLISPSKEQVGSQNACESLPLVMEPESAFYTPLVVLDFQSLYPSIMIAYNY